jgi:serine/threonine protein kinase
MAPETIFERVYTTKSDVWSFGILVWEVVTLGDSPYMNVPLQELVDWLRSGKRLDRPHDCPDNLYEVMTGCWKLDPQERLTWNELVRILYGMYSGRFSL